MAMVAAFVASEEETRRTMTASDGGNCGDDVDATCCSSSKLNFGQPIPVAQVVLDLDVTQLENIIKAKIRYG